MTEIVAKVLAPGFGSSKSGAVVSGYVGWQRYGSRPIRYVGEGWDAGLFRCTLRKRQHIEVVVSLYFGCHNLKKSVRCCKLL